MADIASEASIALDPLTADAGIGNGTDLNLDVILDVPVSLSLEVGRTRIPIRNLSVRAHDLEMVVQADVGA